MREGLLFEEDVAYFITSESNIVQWKRLNCCSLLNFFN